MKTRDGSGGVFKRIKALFVMAALLVSLVPAPALAGTVTSSTSQGSKYTYTNMVVRLLTINKKTFKWRTMKASIRKVKGTRGAVDVYWATDKQATRYQIRYAKTKGMQGARTLICRKGSSCTRIKNLKRNQVYYVQVRKVHVENGKTYYSSWSAAARVVSR